MGLEQDRAFLSGFLAALVRQRVKLSGGLFAGFHDAGLFGGDIRDFRLGNVIVGTLEEVKGTSHDAFGNALALNQNHTSVPPMML